MIGAITGLLFCQLAGEVLARALGLPLPGPVIGLGLMFAFLAWRGRRADIAAVPPALASVTDGLLGNLSLLFIPAAVGIVQYLGLLGRYAGAIAVAIAASSALTLTITALTFRWLARRWMPAIEDDPEDRL
jgi:holin-like protein